MQLRLVWGVMIVMGIAAVAALAGGLSLSYFSDPDPRTASREALVRWLATSDVADLPLQTQDAWVDRLAAELRENADFAGKREIADKYRETLSQNVETLKARWFVTRSLRHAELSGDERDAHLDEQIDTLLAWAKIDKALAGSARCRSTSDFFADIRCWISDERDAGLRAKMKNAVSDGLVRWLAMHDLAEQPMTVRRELARVIAAGLNDGASAKAQVADSSDAEQTLLRANGRLLMEAWLLAQAEIYATLAAGERGPFIDARLDEVNRWGVLQLLADNAEQAAQPALAMAQLGREIEVWIARAEPQQQTQLRALASDVQARLVVRMLQSLRGA